MSRHNRDGEGVDQRGFAYGVSYQLDWLRHVKITRLLPSGRQSTMTLFRNPVERSVRRSGDRVRTRVTCPEQGVDVEVVVNGDREGVSRVTVSCEVPSADGKGVEDSDLHLGERASILLRRVAVPSRHCLSFSVPL